MVACTSSQTRVDAFVLVLHELETIKPVENYRCRSSPL